jgi:predicted DNA-binding protein
MNDKKLIISGKKFRGETSVVSVRLPNDMIEKLDEIAEETGRTRNEIVTKCLVFAIENLIIDKKLK